jgi:diadenosine tetraphosphate (Ap4A) HIT family hydrolase
MTWVFDQAPNAACVASSTVVTGGPVLVVTHYEDDHSWAFLDGQSFDPSQAMVVAMSTVLELHPDLTDIASLPPGWTANRTAAGQPWSMQRDFWAPDLN